MQKKLLAVAIASVVGLAGCNDDDHTTAPQTTSSLSGTVNKGIVSRGIVEVCDTFDENGCDIDGNYYYKTTTSESGTYKTDARAPLNTPLLVRVTADADTRMVCDVALCTDTNAPLAVGQNSVGFGETFLVDNNWDLKAIIAEAKKLNKTVNVTSLTDIMTEEVLKQAPIHNIAAQAQIDGTGTELQIDAIGITPTIIANAEQAVKDAFRIVTDDLTEIGAVNLTDPAAVAKALADLDDDDYKAALYSAALMEYMDEDSHSFDSDNDGLGDIDELFSIDEQAQDGSYDFSEYGNPLKLAAVVRKATSVADEIKKGLHGIVNQKQADNHDYDDGKYVAPNLSALDAIAAELGTESVSNLPTHSKAIKLTSEVAAAQKFIQNIRTAYNSAQRNGKLYIGVDSVTTELEAIKPLASADFDAISRNTSLAIKAIDKAYKANQDAINRGHSALATYQDTDFTVSIKGNIYSITKQRGITLTATANGVNLNKANNSNYSRQELDLFNSNTTYSIQNAPCQVNDPCYDKKVTKVEGSIDINLLTVTYGNTTLTAKGTANVTDGLSDAKESWAKDSYYNPSTGNNRFTEVTTAQQNISADNVEMSLTNVTLAYKDTVHDATFNGKLDLAFTGLSNTYAETNEYHHDDYYTDLTTTNAQEYPVTSYLSNVKGYEDKASHKATKFATGNVLFTGNITTPTARTGEEYLGVTLNVAIDNSLGYIHSKNVTFRDALEYSYNTLTGAHSEKSEFNDDTDRSEETADKYAKFTVVAEVTANVEDAGNNNMAASVKLNASRTAFETLEAEVSVDYNDVSTIVSADYGLQTEDISDVTIKNTTGVQAVMRDVEEDFEGIITVNGVKAATIEKANGLAVVRYNNGQFETLF